MHKPLTTDQFVLFQTPVASLYLLLQQKCILIKVTFTHGCHKEQPKDAFHILVQK